MKQFKEILEEFHGGARIPMIKRRGAGGQIFCPHCGRTFAYYRDGAKCIHCKKDIFVPLKYNDEDWENTQSSNTLTSYKVSNIPRGDINGYEYENDIDRDEDE